MSNRRASLRSSSSPGAPTPNAPTPRSKSKSRSKSRSRLSSKLASSSPSKTIKEERPAKKNTDTAKKKDGPRTSGGKLIADFKPPPVATIIKGLLKPKPWLIFPEDKGSIGGFFDFVPEYLRVGPWFFLAPVFVLAYTLSIFYLKPPINLASTDPQLYSFPHIFSLVSTLNGCHILHMILSKTGPAPLVTFTIISWTILTFRGFLAFLNPFYPIPFLSTLSSSLRFPALVAATVTFVIWNFVLAPIFYTFWSKGEEAKKKFKNWNTQYHMIHIHFLNYPIAIVSCVLTCENVLFTEVDLWISYFVLFMYACLYLFILDRIGVHLYPVFSPRSKFSCFTWLTVFGLYYATFNFWNFVIEGQYLRDVVTPLFSK